MTNLSPWSHNVAWRCHWTLLEKEDAGIVIVKGARYRDMMQNFLDPQIQEQGQQNMFFEEAGVACHTN